MKPEDWFSVIWALSSVDGHVTFFIWCATCYTEILILPIYKVVYLQYEEVAMIYVGVDDLKPGMILELPVKNSQRVLLLEAGARITKKNIHILKSWGVTGVTIKGQVARAGDAAGRSDLRMRESDANQLKEKFSEVLDNPVMVEIYKAATKQLDLILNSDESPDEHSGPAKNN